jgi:hypothetical protein
MLKASVRALTLLALTRSLFGASFSWTLTPASDVAPQGQPIVIYVDLRGPVLGRRLFPSNLILLPGFKRR